MKYRCWQTATDRFHTEIVLQLIMSSTKETNKAVKTKKTTSGAEDKLKQPNSTLQGIKRGFSALSELHRVDV